MKVLIIQPPKYYWPYISTDDNFLVPQALPCLGAVVREAGMDVRLIDCSPMKMGWKSLASEIEKEKPDVVGVGENHALYSHESLKALKLAKDINPSTVTVAGGSHFTNLVEDTLSQDYVDFIAMREGEKTFVELLDRIKAGGGSYGDIRGIAYRDNGETVTTPPRSLIDDLDSLPMPAYDLMPMELYGRSKYLFSPGGTTIHHSRGCVSNCSFCAWWLQMAEPREKDGEIVFRPRWRTKSVGRVIEEIRLLATRYNKRCLVFVDEFWNRDPEWSSEFADAMLAADFGRVEWFAFMRADAVIRDEEKGILEKLVRSGLVHVSVGVERVERDELRKMNKGFYSEDRTVECFRVLSDKYPGVFRQGTFIVGVREETKETIIAQADFAKKLRLDYPGFHPITPVPGTAFWHEARENDWIEVEDYGEYDWMTPIISSKYMTREEIEEMLLLLSRRFVSFGWFIRGITSRSRYKRMMYVWWLIVTLRVVWDSIKHMMPIKTKTYSGLVKPDWYDD